MRTEVGDRTTQEQDRLMQARFKDQAHMHTLRMWVRNVFFFVGTVVVLIIWLGEGSNSVVAMGVLCGDRLCLAGGD